MNYNHSRISGLVGHCTIAVSRELCVFHVDRVWTSTRRGVRPTWTHVDRGGVKNLIFCGRHKWMAPK